MKCPEVRVLPHLQGLPHLLFMIIVCQPLSSLPWTCLCYGLRGTALVGSNVQNYQSNVTLNTFH